MTKLLLLLQLLLQIAKGDGDHVCGSLDSIAIASRHLRILLLLLFSSSWYHCNRILRTHGIAPIAVAVCRVCCHCYLQCTEFIALCARLWIHPDQGHGEKESMVALKHLHGRGGWHRVLRVISRVIFVDLGTAAWRASFKP